MKNITLKALIVLAGVLSAAGAFAQEKIIESNVPFAFSVGNKVLPAGRYEIKQFGSEQAPAGVLVRNIDYPNYGAVALVSVDPSQGMPNQQTSDSRLVFVNYSGHYFLREVRGPADSVNAEFTVTESEKSGKHAVASNATQTTVVGGQ